MVMPSGKTHDALTRSSATAMDTAEEAFRQMYPAFASTSFLDDLRAKEYARLDEQEHLYLDYTGGGLYAESQIRAHLELLRRSVFGNPHSSNPTSRAMTELVAQARACVLEFFHASPSDYTVIFTPNASGALRLVGEAYPFVPGGHYLLPFDNHNSVNGIREFARARGARVCYLPVDPPDLRVDESELFASLDQADDDHHHLFAYPAQSNFSGVQHPLEWIEAAQARGWDVLVDAASFVPSNCLDLARWHPDFVPISFYKMFGYPTGVGCLLARKAALTKLQRPWFAGGTVWGASVQGEGHILLEDEGAFEDGTVNYLSLPAVEIGLNHLRHLGMEMIHERVMCLTDWLLDTLLSLHHRNGRPVVQVYGPHDTQMRGGTIALNFLDPRGSLVDERVVERRANTYHISLRTGCFCNPGAGEAAFHLSKESLLRIFQSESNARLSELFQSQEQTKWDQFLTDLGMQSGGAVRVSLGLITNFADVYWFVRFAQTFLDSFPSEHDVPPRWHC